MRRRLCATPGVTPRYVQLLMEGFGKSLSRHVREMRLDEARRMLRDAAFDHLRITDIAYAVGFQDILFQPRLSQPLRRAAICRARRQLKAQGPRAGRRGNDVADIDDIDRTLLSLLQENGRTSYAELGKAVGLSISSVNERVRKLHDRGVIEGVYSAISPSALRLDLLGVHLRRLDRSGHRSAVPRARRQGARRSSNATTSPARGTIC